MPGASLPVNAVTGNGTDYRITFAVPPWTGTTALTSVSVGEHCSRQDSTGRWAVTLGTATNSRIARIGHGAPINPKPVVCHS